MTALAGTGLAFLLALARTSALIGFAPGLSTAALPAQTKALLSLALALLLAPFLVFNPAQINLPQLDLLHAALLLLHEIAAGAAIGLAMELCFEAVRIAGQICGIQFGLSLASIIDPFSQSESTVVSSFLQTVALALFFALGAQEKLIRLLFASYANLPPGQALSAGPVLSAVAKFAGGAFSSGTSMAAPVVAITLLLDVVVALVARVAPQLPVVPVGISLKALTGMSVLGAALLYWPGTLSRLFQSGLSVAMQVARHG